MHWLQQDAGTAPPVDLDLDAVQAVYCLRPDLAPPIRLDIDTILADVHQGPLAARPADDPAVAALVHWLAENPGAAPPDDMDDDVVEAVFALRPDLAPPPRVALDDILGAVTAGPFAVAVPTRRQT
ncbi:MAG: hypothetical protein GXP62_10360, partial [Oligoflexia bacterium]|nr:hypothetical protein [Oligoflexia bacterium]